MKIMIFRVAFSLSTSVLFFTLLIYHGVATNTAPNKSANSARFGQLLVKKSIESSENSGFLVESKNFTVSIEMYNVGKTPAEEIVLEDAWDEDLFEVVEGSSRSVQLAQTR